MRKEIFWNATSNGVTVFFKQNATGFHCSKYSGAKTVRESATIFLTKTGVDNPSKMDIRKGGVKWQ